MNNEQLGINISGFFKAEIGFGEATRGYIKALDSAKIPYSAINFNMQLRDRLNDSSVELLNDSQKFGINLIQINPDTLPSFFEEKGLDFFKNKYNIAFWAWELSDFPEVYCQYFDYFDEIWTPSKYCQDVISLKSPIPVTDIPHVIDINNSEIVALSKEFNFPKNKFTFLFIFDYNSNIKRKNTLSLIDAFLAGFHGNDDVQLIIKTGIPTYAPKDKILLAEKVKGINNIILMEEMLRREELLSLMNQCDCYISLHRSEGFGLTIAEAMGLGKPVISTGYSGNMEFMNVNNSFPVKYDLIELKEDLGPLKKGAFWSEPNISHATDLMKFVYENQKVAKKIGDRARQDIQDYFSPKAIGEKIKTRLEIIQKDILSKPKQSELESKLTQYKMENLVLNKKVNYLERTLYNKLRKKINLFFSSKRNKK